MYWKYMFIFVLLPTLIQGQDAEAHLKRDVGGATESFECVDKASNCPDFKDHCVTVPWMRTLCPETCDHPCTWPPDEWGLGIPDESSRIKPIAIAKNIGGLPLNSQMESPAARHGGNITCHSKLECFDKEIKKWYTDPKTGCHEFIYCAVGFTSDHPLNICFQCDKEGQTFNEKTCRCDTSGTCASYGGCIIPDK